MSKNIKAVSIESEVIDEAGKVEDTVEEVIIEEAIKETTPKNDDEEKITEIINEEEEEKPKPKQNRKMITCPDCGKTMLERNFRYQHINVCGKVKQPKLRAKPIEEVIKEKQEKAKLVETSPLTIQRAVTQPEITEVPKAVDYWSLRREYTNHLKERKQQLAQKLVAKAFL